MASVLKWGIVLHTWDYACDCMSELHLTGEFRSRCPLRGTGTQPHLRQVGIVLLRLVREETKDSYPRCGFPWIIGHQSKWLGPREIVLRLNAFTSH